MKLISKVSDKVFDKVKVAAGTALFGLACLAGFEAKGQVLVTNIPGQNKFSEYAIPSTLALNGTTNFTGNYPPFLINPGYGVGIEACWTNAGSSAVSNVVFYLFPTVDGTNYSTRAYLSWSPIVKAGVATRDATNFPASLFDSFWGVSLMVSNGDAANAIGFTNRVVRLTRPKINR